MVPSGWLLNGLWDTAFVVLGAPVTYTDHTPLVVDSLFLLRAVSF